MKMDLCCRVIKYDIVKAKPMSNTMKTKFGGWGHYLTLAFRIMVMIEYEIFTKNKALYNR